MIGTLPPNYNNGQIMHNANGAAYHQDAPTATWSELNARLEEAVKNGRLTQEKANQILAHFAQKHDLGQ